MNHHKAIKTKMAASTEVKPDLELQDKTPAGASGAGSTTVTMSSKSAGKDEWPAPVIAKKVSKSSAEKSPERYPKRIREFFSVHFPCALILYVYFHHNFTSQFGCHMIICLHCSG
jgi:hypothetical protein